MFLRTLVSNAVSMLRPLRQGDGIVANVQVAVDATNNNVTMSIPQLMGGAVQYTSFSTGRNITTPTAANIIAANPGMDIGDSLMLIVSCVAGFAGTYVAGDGVTLAGRATTPASSYSIIIITRTGAATVSWRVM
jgi:hypothetical protein